MQVYVFNQFRELTGIVEDFEYLSWTRRYSQPGSFTLKAIGSACNADMLKLGCWLWKSDDREAIMVSGKFATGLLARRIIWGTEILNGTLDSSIAQIMNNHLLNPDDPDRTIPGIAFSSPPIASLVQSQISYRNLLDTVTGLLIAADAGIKTTFDPTTRDLTIRLYQGEESLAVFSREYENIVSQTYTTGVTDYAETVLVAGEGEGEERETVVIPGTSGIDRFELFVDARDLQSEDFPDNYTEALLFRGQSKLAEHALVQSFDAEVSLRSNLVYKQDYDIGNMVTVQSRRWGLSLRTRITEITETYDASGMSLDVVFGRGALTLSQKIKEYV
jgi:hypothetical protein